MTIPYASEAQAKTKENEAAVMSALEAIVTKSISVPGNTSQVKIPARVLLDAVKSIQPNEQIVIREFIMDRLVRDLQEKGYVASYGPIGMSNGEPVAGLVITW